MPAPIPAITEPLDGSAGDLRLNAGDSLSHRLTSFMRTSQKTIESIIGPSDDREIVSNTTGLPWRLIAALEISIAGGISYGTGWLAGPRTIVTCGHCLADHAARARATSVTVVPGRYRSSRPFGSVASTRFSAPPQWTEGGLKAWDIGCIHLDEPLGDRLGWFNVSPSIPSPIGQPIRTAGYSEFDTAFGRMLQSKGVVRDAAEGRLFYSADTLDGHSGAPVWLDGGSSEIPQVIALHAYDEVQSPASVGEANSGPLVSGQIASLIAHWRSI